MKEAGNYIIIAFSLIYTKIIDAKGLHKNVIYLFIAIATLIDEV